MRLVQRDANRKNTGVAGMGMTTSFLRFDQFGTGAIGTSDHEGEVRSLVCWSTRLLEGTIQETKRFAPDTAIFKRGCATVCAV